MSLSRSGFPPCDCTYERRDRSQERICECVAPHCCGHCYSTLHQSCVNTMLPSKRRAAPNVTKPTMSKRVSSKAIPTPSDSIFLNLLFV
ncbi:hypothetical protein BC629DRAFT_1537926, partial [Irpex lacteus]